MLNPRLLLALPLLLGLTFGCSSDKDDEDDDDEDGSDGEDGGDGGDGGSSDGVSPYITEGVAYCDEGSASSGMVFFFEIQADDPQRTYTLAGFGGSLSGYDLEDNLIFTDEGIACAGDGACVHSFNDLQHSPVSCATADQYYFEAVVEDEDGNLSDPYRLEWQGGPG